MTPKNSEADRRDGLYARPYVLFIELGRRRVLLAGCSLNPSGAWVT
jgi:hypothetical protein